MLQRIFAIVFGTAGLWSAAVGGVTLSADHAATLTLEQARLNVESFDVVWKTIRDRHWEPEIAGLDWDALREAMEGVGVIPDVIVAPDREALLNQRDLTLDAAVSWIRTQQEPNEDRDWRNEP